MDQNPAFWPSLFECLPSGSFTRVFSAILMCPTIRTAANELVRVPDRLSWKMPARLFSIHQLWGLPHTRSKITRTWRRIFRMLLESLAAKGCSLHVQEQFSNENQLRQIHWFLCNFLINLWIQIYEWINSACPPDRLNIFVLVVVVGVCWHAWPASAAQSVHAVRWSLAVPSAFCLHTADGALSTLSLAAVF